MFAHSSFTCHKRNVMHCDWTWNRINSKRYEKIHHKNPPIRISNEQLNCAKNKLQRLFDRPKKKQNKTKEKKKFHEISVFEYVCQMEMWCFRQRIRIDVIFSNGFSYTSVLPLQQQEIDSEPIHCSFRQTVIVWTDNNCTRNVFGLNESEDKKGERERKRFEKWLRFK